MDSQICTPMSVLDLPVELLQLVVDSLSQSDTLQLSLSCKGFYEIAMKRLYRSVLVRFSTSKKEEKSRAFAHLAGWSIMTIDDPTKHNPVWGQYESEWWSFQVNQASQMLRRFIGANNPNLANIHSLKIVSEVYARSIAIAVLDHTYIRNRLSSLTHLYIDPGSLHDFPQAQYLLYSNFITSQHQLKNLQISLYQLFSLAAITGPPAKLIDSLKNIECLELIVMDGPEIYDDNYFYLFLSLDNLANLSLIRSFGKGTMGLIRWLGSCCRRFTNKTSLLSRIETLQLHLAHYESSRLEASAFYEVFDPNSIKRLSIQVDCNIRGDDGDHCGCHAQFMEELKLPELTELIIEGITYQGITNLFSRNNYPKLKKIMSLSECSTKYLERQQEWCLSFLNLLPKTIEILHLNKFFLAIKADIQIGVRFISFLDERLGDFNLYYKRRVIEQLATLQSENSDHLARIGSLQNGFDFWTLPTIVDSTSELGSFASDHLETYNESEDHFKIFSKVCVEFIRDLISSLIYIYPKLHYLNFGIAQFQVIREKDKDPFARSLNITVGDIKGREI